MKDRFATALLGAICLVLGWGAATLLHECGHIVVAHSLGYDTSMGALTLTTGSVFVHGDLTDAQTALIAVAGSFTLIIAGVALVRISSNPALRMIGIIFLSRAFIDVLPIHGFDGGLIAGSAGYVVAVSIAIVEVFVCGEVILSAIGTKEQQL